MESGRRERGLLASDSGKRTRMEEEEALDPGLETWVGF